MKYISQNEMVLGLLQSGETLTPLEALEIFSCFRLGARIYDLKKLGHNIKTEMVKLRSGKRVARYSLESEV